MAAHVLGTRDDRINTISLTYYRARVFLLPLVIILVTPFFLVTALPKYQCARKLEKTLLYSPTVPEELGGLPDLRPIQ